MTSNSPRPWLQCVELHSDVLSDTFSEDIFALDLGGLSDYLIGTDVGQSNAELPRVPAVYRDAGTFFAASYLTSGLKSLLEDVLGRLDGKDGNRVLKLLTPFGGGKSHTLAALLHAARSRTELDVLPEATGLPRPQGVRVAVVDGQFFDATAGKRTPKDDIIAKTLWGWIGWALGGHEGYKLVQAQDQARVAPGSDVLVELLRRGPSLILLDELLEYLISAGGIPIEQTTLRDETLSFLKRLTVAVGNVGNAVLVYSLQSSKRESLEYTQLHQTLEHLASRKDQQREPVEGNEILRVIQRRLLSKTADVSTVTTTAETYGRLFVQMRRAYSHGESDRQRAEDDGLALRERIKASYPFHPALIDLMRERWAAIPDFQRTRGTLRFLAFCLRAAHRSGNSRLLLGPGDVPMADDRVRLAFLKEVGQREDFQACLEHDFIGANARSRYIDERREKEATAESGKQSATRIATTMLLYSFGGLKRGESADGEFLPPGIRESELLDINIAPDLDTTTIQACLKELKERCLYLHFDEVRYCFKKDPNVTLLVEQEANAIASDESRVRSRIREMLEERLSGQISAIVWPSKSIEIPDHDPQFLIAYLPFEFAAQQEEVKQQIALDLCGNCGNQQRVFRNGLGLAVPAADQVEILERSVRYVLAVERVQATWKEHNLTQSQKRQLKEREQTERSASESALLKLYGEVRLPTSDDKNLTLETTTVGGRPLQTTLNERRHALIHQRLLELLMTVQRRVFDTLAPGKIVELFQLYDTETDQPGIETAAVSSGFYEFIGFPRLQSSETVRKAIVSGIEMGLFGYVTGRPSLGNDGRYKIDRSRIVFERSVATDEIDLASGFLILPHALPLADSDSGSSSAGEGDDTDEAEQSVNGGNSEETTGTSTGEDTEPTSLLDGREINLSFTATGENLYHAWNALANLANMAGIVSISANTSLPSEYDRSKLENGVLEPLRELGLITDDE